MEAHPAEVVVADRTLHLGAAALDLLDIGVAVLIGALLHTVLEEQLGESLLVFYIFFVDCVEALLEFNQ